VLTAIIDTAGISGKISGNFSVPVYTVDTLDILDTLNIINNIETKTFVTMSTREAMMGVIQTLHIHVHSSSGRRQYDAYGQCSLLR
jgi:hypothetical protein